MRLNLKFKILLLLLIVYISYFKLKSQDRFTPVIIKDDINISMAALGGMTMRDGGYVIYTDAAKKNNDIYGHISKYDVNGKQLWYKRFDEFCPESIIELKDGGVIICGQTAFAGWDRFKSMFIVKLDFCGDVEWAKFDTVNNRYLDVFSLRTMIDTGDGIIFPMRFDSNEPPIGTPQVRTDILKIDYSGKVIFRKWIEEHGGEQEIWDGKMDSDGNIIMNGSCIAKNPNDNGYGTSPLIIKCDSEGNLLYMESAADNNGIDVFGRDYRNKSIIDVDDNYFTYVSDSFIPLGGGKFDYLSTIIKADKQDKITTHKFVNPDIQFPDDRRSLYGLAFINNQQNLITTMNYIHDDNIPKNNNRQQKFNPLKLDNTPFINYQSKDFYSTSKEDGDNDDYWKIVRNRLYMLDKEAKVIDSTDLEQYFDLGEVTKHIFSTNNNEVILLTTNRRFYEYVTRIHKFNSDLEPALIDNTPREYDIYCDGQITSGLVKPEWEPLYPPDMIQEFNKEQPILRLSPNPAQNSVKLYLNFGFGEKQIEFYDTTGRLCKTITVTDGWAQETIDISDLKHGIYIVKLKSENNITATEKLIVK